MLRKVLSIVVLSNGAVLAHAWMYPSTYTARRPDTKLASELSRDSFVKVAFASAAALSWMPGAGMAAAATTTLPNGVSYTVKKEGKGVMPVSGDLVAIRFAAYNGDTKIDDIFETPEPYYTRVGGGGLLKGVEDTLPLMKVGDRWELTIPAELAFGKKGRPSSAGKPRIASDATIVFDIEMVGLPGKEEELIELIGD